MPVLHSATSWYAVECTWICERCTDPASKEQWCQTVDRTSNQLLTWWVVSLSLCLFVYLPLFSVFQFLLHCVLEFYIMLHYLWEHSGFRGGWIRYAIRFGTCLFPPKYITIWIRMLINTNSPLIFIFTECFKYLQEVFFSLEHNFFFFGYVLLINRRTPVGLA